MGHMHNCVLGYVDKNLKNLAGAVGALPLVCSIVWLLVSQLKVWRDSLLHLPFLCGETPFSPRKYNNNPNIMQIFAPFFSFWAPITFVLKKN